MRCFRAISGRKGYANYTTFTGGFFQCLHWSQGQLEQHELIKIEKQYAGEKKAQVIAEISCEGVRMILSGSVRKVSRVEA